MAGLLLFGLVPLLIYCVIQTVRDGLSRRPVMATYGTAMTAMLLYLLKSVLDNPGY